MSRLAVFFSVVVASCAAAKFTVVDVGQLEGQGQAANGQSGFNYFSTEAEDAAVVFASYPHKYDCAVKRQVDELKKQYTIHHPLVDECASTIPHSYTDKLNKTVTESLAEVQRIDNELRQNAMVCASLRIDEPKGCVQARRNSLESLAKVSSEEEFERINQVMKAASSDAKSYLEGCIEVNISH